ncbi:MAG: lysine--tRNA ligase [Planctomycetota bacterium]|jgi:lysyl-tRNA synthetase class 2
MSERLFNERRAKAEKLRAMGIDPYGGRYDGALPVAEVLALYDPDSEGAPANAAGRITALRSHGKSTFLDITDWTGKVQVYLQKNRLGEGAYELVSLLDIGDIIAAKGGLHKTRTGEITIFADEFRLLTKSLRPLPEKWHGLKDVETRHRRRYLDLISNSDVMDTFKKRIAILKAIRAYLDGLGFVEVETPMMHPLATGAAALPFTTHHNALDIDLYLRIAPELYLKRLLVGGIEKVYEINRNFRNEGISVKHNPEFTMLELYEAYTDYNGMMDVTEGMFAAAMEAVGVGDRVEFDGREIDLARPWARRTYRELVEEAAGCPIDDEKAVRARAMAAGIEVGAKPHYILVQDLFETLVEPKLVNPTFVTEYPTPLCPLTKEKAGDPTVAERFELIVSGMEFANAYTELNDPVEQRERFLTQLEGADQAGQLDEDFLLALEHGMPPAGGLGVGIDRLVMLLTGNRSIREVILFPLLRPVDRGGTESIEPTESDAEAEQ